MNSATMGAKMVKILEAVFDIPNIVAEKIGGNMSELAIYTIQKVLEHPNLAIKIRKELKFSDLLGIIIKRSDPSVDIKKLDTNVFLTPSF